ncbi:MAG TPA: hypothetical protein VKG89_03545 [Solirubrobacterales bacterium]|nr:hypothetical protein [Solirubrobacterales bacterium]
MGLALAGADRERRRAAPRPYVDALLHLAALSIVAGAIHAVVAGPHFGEYWVFGSFFVALAAVQLGWGAWVYARPSALAFQAGIGISAGVVALWIVSRTLGLPFGPEHWQAESAGAIDLAATASEALIAVLCAAFLATAAQAPAPHALPSRLRILEPLAILTMGAALLVLVLGGGHHAH